MPVVQRLVDRLMQKQSVGSGIRKNEAPLLSVQANNIGGEYGRFVIPCERHTYHFNPSVMDHAGKRWLVSRKFWMDYETPWDYLSKMAAHEIREDMTLGPERMISPKLRDPRESFEDPRCSVAFGKQCIGAVAWITPNQEQIKNMQKGHYKPKIVIHQSLFQLGKGLEVEKIIDVEYGGNGPSIFAGTRAEKNWLWFDHDGKTYFIYQAEPHLVVEVAGDKVVQEHRTHAALGWTVGEIRGGTPPIRVGDHYLTFFHSSMPWKKLPRYGTRNVYFMGAYLFEAKPPFKIVAATRERLLTGTWNEPIQEGVPAVVYPNGALLDGNQWLITMGVNDCACGWVKIDHSEIERRLSSCS